MSYKLLTLVRSELTSDVLHLDDIKTFELLTKLSEQASKENKTVDQLFAKQLQLTIDKLLKD